MVSRKLVALATVALLVTGCGAGPTSRAGRQESGAAARSSPTVAPGTGDADDQVTVRVHRLRLRSGGETGGDRIRVMVGNSTPHLRVTISGPIDQGENAVTVCAVTDETSVPPGTNCVLPVAERPVDLPADPNLRGAEISIAGRPAVLDLREIAITYTAQNRQVRLLLPNLDPLTDDPGCLGLGCPAFELTPPRNGNLVGEASWDDPGGGALDIRTTAAMPSPGVSPAPPAYRVVSSSASASNSGPGSVSISSTVREDHQSLMVLTNTGEGPLLTPVLEATWP